MDSKIIGAGLVAASVIILAGIMDNRPIARPIVGVFGATFLLAGMSVAGAPQIAGNLAVLAGGTIVVIYAPSILKQFEGL